MPTFHGGSEIYDDDDTELLGVRHERKTTRVRFVEPYQYNLPPASQTQATPSHKQLEKEAFDRFRSENFSKSITNKGTNATSKLASEDEIMTDTMAELTEKDVVKLPSLRHILPEGDYTREQDRNIDRPYYYDKLVHREGFVAWWDNRTGKGMIIDHQNNLEHKIELSTYLRSSFFPLWNQILSLETCLGNVYSVDTFQGSMIPD